MTRVLIVGGGFAGASAARAFEKSARRNRLDVLLVDKQNFMVFTPMLPEVASGSIEPRHIVQPFRSSLRRTRFELGEVVSASTQRRTLGVRHPLTGQTREIEYDELILALGSTPSTMGVPGAREHGLPLRTVADAQQIRDRMLGALEVAAKTKDIVERDRLLRFVIVGGGFTGVEAAGELRGFLHSVVRYYPSIDFEQIAIAIVQGEGRLLPHLAEKFGTYAATSLHDRGVRILTGEDAASLDERGLTLKSGKRLESRTVIWSAGTEPAPVVKALGVETDEHGAVKANADFSVPGHPHVWAIGDCAAIPKPGGGTYGPLAQNAIREGPLVALNVAAFLRNRPTRNFRYEKRGQMASLGDRRAVAELPGDRMLTGMPAWALWRAYYLSRLPGTNKRTRVAIDWTLSLVFPPELAWLPGVRKGKTSFEDAYETHG
ncbi:MAG: NAD(P)/FAD-dependent oxidoreductase [Candidatus Tyrphobacter sp.]